MIGYIFHNSVATLGRESLKHYTVFVKLRTFFAGQLHVLETAMKWVFYACLEVKFGRGGGGAGAACARESGNVST